MDSPRKITKIKLKRCEKTDSSNAKSLSKISCQIGDHLVHAHISSGSSISIASTDFYRKLVADKYIFRDGKFTLNLIDESIPNQAYRVTTVTVKVIGKSRSINLVTFPDVFSHRTILGMDFLSTKSDAASSDDAAFRVPEKPAAKSNPIRPVVDENQPITLLDWILDTSNLQKPLYNILADGTADDDDLFAICAFMKRMPRMVSPIRSLEEISSCRGKRVDAEQNIVSIDKTDGTAIVSDCVSSKNPPIVLETSAPLLHKAKPKVSLSANHDTTSLKSSEAPTVPLSKPRGSDMSSTSVNETSLLRTLLLTTSFDKKEEKIISWSPNSIVAISKPLPQATKSPDEKDKNSLTKQPISTSTALASTPSATSSVNVVEKVLNSSSKNQTNTPGSLTASVETAKDKVESVLLKNPTAISRTSTIPMEQVKVVSKNPTFTSQASSLRVSENTASSSSKNTTTTSRTSATSMEKDKTVSSLSKKPTSTSQTSSVKLSEKAPGLSSKNMTTTPRPSTTPMEKEKENVGSSSLKNQIATATPMETAKQKVMNAWSMNQTDSSTMPTPSRTSMYKEKEMNKSSSSRHQTTTSGTLDRVKDKATSSSSKVRTNTSTRTSSSTSHHRASLSKSGRH